MKVKTKAILVLVALLLGELLLLGMAAMAVVLIEEGEMFDSMAPMAILVGAVIGAFGLRIGQIALQLLDRRAGLDPPPESELSPETQAAAKRAAWDV
jgi:hypothetical protein